jgi:hypothetical protein
MRHFGIEENELQEVEGIELTVSRVKIMTLLKFGDETLEVESNLIVFSNLENILPMRTIVGI